MRLTPRGGTHSVSPLRRLLAGCAVILAASACSAGADDAVVFGVVAPLEESYGASALLGAELARQEINDAGGIRGRPLQLRPVDDQADAQTAPRVAEELFTDPSVLAVVGHVNSSTMTAAAPVYEQGLPAVASATSPVVSRLGEWIFRISTSDSVNAVELAQHARRINQPTAILYENDSYGRGLAESFESALRAAGGTVLESDPYLESTPDFTPYLERLKRQDVGLIFVAGLEVGAARLIEQARALGIDARFLGGDGVEGLVEMGPAFDGTLVGLLYHPDRSPAARAFADRFRALHGRDPDSFAAMAYDATHLLARAAAEGGRSRKAIRAYLAEVGRDGGRPPFVGATGTIRFDENGDPVEKGFTVGVIRAAKIHLNGKL